MTENGTSGGGWFSYNPGQPNPHLTAEQLATVEHFEAEADARRGPQVARVVIDVFASGEAVPQVQFLRDEASVEAAALIVEQAAVALASWR